MAELDTTTKILTAIFGDDPETFRRLAGGAEKAADVGETILQSPSKGLAKVFGSPDQLKGNFERGRKAASDFDVLIPAALGAKPGTRSDAAGLLGTAFRAASSPGLIADFFLDKGTPESKQRAKKLGLVPPAAAAIVGTNTQPKEEPKATPPAGPSGLPGQVIARTGPVKEPPPFQPTVAPEIPDLSRVTEALEAARPIATSPRELEQIQRDNFLLTFSQGLEKATEAEILSFADELRIIGTSLLQAQVAGREAVRSATREDTAAMRQYNIALAQGELAETKFLFEAKFDQTRFIAEQQEKASLDALERFRAKQPKAVAVSGGIVITTTEPDGSTSTKFIDTLTGAKLAAANAKRNNAFKTPGIIGSALHDKNENAVIMLLNEPASRVRWNEIFGEEDTGIVSEIFAEAEAQFGPSRAIRDPKRVADDFENFVLHRLAQELYGNPAAMERFIKFANRQAGT